MAAPITTSAPMMMKNFFLLMAAILFKCFPSPVAPRPERLELLQVLHGLQRPERVVVDAGRV
jgi:hypothetical protein